MSTNDTQPITNAELAAAMSAAMSAVASTFSVMVDMPRGVQPVTMTAEDCRHMASLIDSSAALILRRAAELIDPPTVPAEPDLTTPEGWATALGSHDTVSWCDMPKPVTDAQRSALVAAWSDMLAHRRPVTATKLAMVLAASYEDASDYEA